jgi:hypothetical protein
MRTARLLIAAILSLALAGCPATSTTAPKADGSSSDGALNSLPTASPTPSLSTSLPGGARAVKIIFKAAAGGSFNAAPSAGTVNQPNSGHKAVRVFSPDGGLLSQGDASTATWPKWLTHVEIGVSGSANTAALNPDCARFAATGEDTNFKCDWDADGLDPVPCGAEPGYYRVSEYDCTNTQVPPVASAGIGGPADGIYVRARFNRDKTYLGATENVLAVLEYASSAVVRTPAASTSCYDANGIFSPGMAGCSDHVWQVFLKHNAHEVVQPYQLLVPPHPSYVSASLNAGGGSRATRQFLVPLSGDPNLSIVQISRIRAFTNPSVTDTAATPDNVYYPVCQKPQGSVNVASNTPFCVGMVLYSLTLFRI